MTLIEFILTYEGVTDSGEKGVVANISDYYARYITILDKKFKHGRLSGRDKVICPFHDDTDPSLGLIKHKFFKNVGVYHCLGCGVAGTIVRMHQRIQKQYYGVDLTEREACESLAVLFHIPIEEFDEYEDEDLDVRYLRTSKKINRLALSSYTIKDFTLELRDLRRGTELPDLNKVNSAYVKMVATRKKLY